MTGIPASAGLVLVALMALGPLAAPGLCESADTVPPTGTLWAFAGGGALLGFLMTRWRWWLALLSVPISCAFPANLCLECLDPALRPNILAEAGSAAVRQAWAALVLVCAANLVGLTEHVLARMGQGDGGDGGFRRRLTRRYFRLLVFLAAVVAGSLFVLPAFGVRGLHTWVQSSTGVLLPGDILPIGVDVQFTGNRDFVFQVVSAQPVSSDTLAEQTTALIDALGRDGLESSGCGAGHEIVKLRPDAFVLKCNRCNPRRHGELIQFVEKSQATVNPGP